MQFPDFYPPELKAYQAAHNGDELFEQLVQKTEDLVSFFEIAADDETWSEKHSDLMKKMIEWFTTRNFQDRLAKEYTQRVAEAIRKHHSVLHPIIFEDITLVFSDRELNINSLLMSSISPFFRQLILRECKDKKLKKLSLEGTYIDFFPFETWMQKGEVVNLPTASKQELISLLRRASEWQVSEIVEQCQRMVIKYITSENAFKVLLKAHNEGWELYKDGCINFINHLKLGFELFSEGLGTLGFEFFVFSEKSMECFDLLHHQITHLRCREKLSENSHFAKVAKACPKLRMLDISASLHFSEYMFEMPKDLQGITLMQCPWLNQTTFKKLYTVCPEIKDMVLTSNVQLKYVDWSELKRFMNLKKLDLSRCHQIENADLDIILKSCPSLNHLILNECKNLDDEGFFILAKEGGHLLRLDLSRCKLTDVALVDIATGCPSLFSVNLAYCEYLTEKGVFALVRNLVSLTEINLTRSPLSLTALVELQKMRPNLKVLY